VEAWRTAAVSVDPLAAVLAAAAIAISYVLYRKSRRSPRITHELRSTPLVSVHTEAQGRITLQLDGQIVEGVALVEARITNTGNAPIRAADFAEPLRVDLGEGAVPLSVEVADSKPPGLDPTCGSKRGP
jgi:hypothetical protein